MLMLLLLLILEELELGLAMGVEDVMVGSDRAAAVLEVEEVGLVVLIRGLLLLKLQLLLVLCGGAMVSAMRMRLNELVVGIECGEMEIARISAVMLLVMLARMDDMMAMVLLLLLLLLRGWAAWVQGHEFLDMLLVYMTIGESDQAMGTTTYNINLRKTLQL